MIFKHSKLMATSWQTGFLFELSQFLLATAVAAVLITSLAGCSDDPRLQPLADDAIILAFGDSLTHGTGTSRSAAYPAVLEGLSGYKVINAGVPGEVSSSGLHRLTALLDQHQPDLVIICHGGNDILRKLDTEKTRSNIQGMIELARRHSSQVMLIGVPAFGLFLDTAPFYESLARDNQLLLDDDSLSEILGNNALKSDRVHPNAAGYHMLAENIYHLLQHAGALPPAR